MSVKIDPNASEQVWLRALENDKETRVIRWCLASGTLLLISILGSLTYGCTQPVGVNLEEQASRLVEREKMIACVRAGGSWIPVRASAAYSSYQMSCVTSVTLPLVQVMNKKD